MLLEPCREEGQRPLDGGLRGLRPPHVCIMGPAWAQEMDAPYAYYTMHPTGVLHDAPCSICYAPCGMRAASPATVEEISVGITWMRSLAQRLVQRKTTSSWQQHGHWAQVAWEE